MLRMWFFALLLISANAYALEEARLPEVATGEQQSQTLIAQHQLSIAAHPLAAEAGYRILRAEGSAADAAVAIQAMLTLVEPQSSGIGGGAFMLYWDNQQRKLSAFDGRETAPAATNASLFLRPDGTPLPWHEALVGGRSVGTPGVLRMLELAHQRHGKQPWATLFQDAIARARSGFSVSPRLHGLIASGINPGLVQSPTARSYFYTTEGQPKPIGSTLTNPQLATTLEQIAQQGADYFYRGPLAQALVDETRQAFRLPGTLSLDDLATYQAKLRSPLCLPYLSYRVCGFPPPTSGGITVLQILKLLEPFPLAQTPSDSAEFNHLFTQASRLAFADRDHYIADSDFVDVPVDQLLTPAYIDQRRRLIHTDRDMGNAAAGEPPQAPPRLTPESSEQPSTSHFVVIDRWGNAASVTSSIEMAFGSTLMVGGFLLNNQLTDFAFTPTRDGALVANRVQPGKRPRSSMAPFMVFDERGELVMLLGSPGGSRIINYVARSLLLALQQQTDLQQAFNTPHVSNRNGITELEEGRTADTLPAALRALGHEVKLRDLNSGLHGASRTAEGFWKSAVDNRREGAAYGD